MVCAFFERCGRSGRCLCSAGLPEGGNEERRDEEPEEQAEELKEEEVEEEKPENEDEGMSRKLKSYWTQIVCLYIWNQLIILVK